MDYQQTKLAELVLETIHPTDVYLKSELVSHDRRFEESASKRFIQELCRLEPDEYRGYLYNVIPEGGKLETHPTCGCGYLRYASKLNEVCPKCKGVVTQTTDVRLETLLWLQKPHHISKFLNLKMFVDIYYSFNPQRTNFDPITFLIDHRYKPTKLKSWQAVVHKNMEMWVSDGLERNWSYFVNNIRTIIPSLVELYKKHGSQGTKAEARQAMLDCEQMVRQTPDDIMYSNVLPILNKYLLTIEKTDVLFYKSKETGLYGAAITDAVNLPCPETNPDIVETRNAKRTANRTIAQMYIRLAEAFFETMKVEGKKGGLFRGDIFGQRDAFTFRGVIKPITRPHAADEIVPPWFAMVRCLQPYINVKLIERGYSPRAALEFVEEYVRVYCKEMEDILYEIIHDFGPMGIPTSLIRYPSLYKHSNTIPFVRHVNTDPEDRTIGVPAACLPGKNGDFDGDELSAMFLFTKYVVDGLMPMHISRGLMDLNKPYEYGKAASLPTPTVQAWVGYVNIYPDQ